MAAARKEYLELQEAARKKPNDKRSEADKEALQPWPLVGRTKWIKRNQEFLDKIEGDGNKKYLDSVFLSFKYPSNKVIQDSLLVLVNADAANCKLNLENFTLFSFTGWNSNNKVVPLCYYYLCGNESYEAWKRAINKFKEKFPRLAKKATFCSDQDKGLENAIGTSRYQNLGPRPHFLCAFHRKKNLRSKRLVKIFDQLCYATTLAEIENIKASKEYGYLSNKELKRLKSVADEDQFLLYAADRGGTTYVRPTSQGVEANNSAILKGRSLDIFSSILWMVNRQSRLYAESYRIAHSNNLGLLTPNAKKR